MLDCDRELEGCYEGASWRKHLLGVSVVFAVTCLFLVALVCDRFIQEIYEEQDDLIHQFTSVYSQPVV